MHREFRLCEEPTATLVVRGVTMTEIVGRLTSHSTKFISCKIVGGSCIHFTPVSTCCLVSTLESFTYDAVLQCPHQYDFFQSILEYQMTLDS